MMDISDVTNERKNITTEGGRIRRTEDELVWNERYTQGN